MNHRSVSITLDVDPLRAYRAIHGLGQLDEVSQPQTQTRGRTRTPDPIYTVALPRFWSLIEEVGAPATLFVVGEDAARYADAFSPVHRTGSEIASHSFVHDYRLSQRSQGAIDEDLERARIALLPLAGKDGVVGFRAPGYNVSETLLRCLISGGYLYDSSMLPAPAYFGLRAAAIGAYTITRQPTHSLVGHPRHFAGPLEPYRMTASRPWKPHPRGVLVEIPIACEPTSRLPIIGTSWTTFPAPIRDALLSRAQARLRHLNFEMHAIDLLDATDPGIPPDLVARQRDLRIPLSKKMAAFRSLFARLGKSARFQTLRDVAADLQGAQRAQHPERHRTNETPTEDAGAR